MLPCYNCKGGYRIRSGMRFFGHACGEYTCRGENFGGAEIFGRPTEKFEYFHPSGFSNDFTWDDTMVAPTFKPKQFRG